MTTIIIFRVYFLKINFLNIMQINYYLLLHYFFNRHYWYVLIIPLSMWSIHQSADFSWKTVCLLGSWTMDSFQFLKKLWEDNFYKYIIAGLSETSKILTNFKIMCFYSILLFCDNVFATFKNDTSFIAILSEYYEYLSNVHKPSIAAGFTANSQNN